MRSPIPNEKTSCGCGHSFQVADSDAGCAVLVVSEDLDELFEISDRLVVIARGRVSPAVAAAQATREQIGRWMSGLWDGDAAHAAAEASHAAA